MSPWASHRHTRTPQGWCADCGADLRPLLCRLGFHAWALFPIGVLPEEYCRRCRIQKEGTP